MDDFLKQFPAIIREAAQSILGIFALIILLLSVICFLFFHNAPMGIRIGIFIFISFGFGLFVYALYLKLPPTASHGRLLPDGEPLEKTEASSHEKLESIQNDQGSLKLNEPVSYPPKTYFEWLTSNYGYMDAEKLHGKGAAIPLSLPEIFVQLFAYDPGRKTEKGHSPEERQDPIDIETLISQNDYLLIEGQAGSGKTTLFKHLTYCLANPDREDLRIDGLDGFLPVLILFKDLEDLFDDPEMGRKKDLTAEDILIWYFRNKMENVLNIETVNKLLNTEKVIFLLDGLDEIIPEYRDNVVNAFDNLRIRHKGNKVVFSGRPHGVEGAVVNKFGSMRINILSLNMEQVNLFITKWFNYLYPGTSGRGGKTAESMVGEILDHPSIRQLIDNPLMLTAICILYHDEKELPGQRAELYKKFIDNMLYRRFPDSEKVHAFLKNLAFRMHSKRVRGADKSFIIEILKQIYRKGDNGPAEDSQKRIEKVFNEIEPKCGLLKLEGGQYAFWHLTFQEFLTAQYIVDNSRDYSKAITAYWGDDWYKEVIELYIGYLSIDNKSWANGIIEDIMDSPDDSPFKKWLLASESLVDIHRDRREVEVQDKTRRRLLSIIDSVQEPKVLLQAGEALGWLGDTRDLKEFVRIEGGEYNLEGIGENLKIEPFEIGKYAVTNSWFEEFVKADGYKNKDYWSPEGRKWLDHTNAEQPRFWDDRKWKCPNSPVVGVCWYEAYAFTQWLTLTLYDDYNYRLLCEKEWQAAAAGKEGRKYPWGEKWDKNRCNNSEINLEKTSPVGIFKEGDTPEVTSDLSGNVWEWTTSDYHSGKDLNDFIFNLELDFESSQLPVLRGGSWIYEASNCRCADRSRLFPDDGYIDVGFRCARTVKL